MDRRTYALFAGDMPNLVRSRKCRISPTLASPSPPGEHRLERSGILLCEVFLQLDRESGSIARAASYSPVSLAEIQEHESFAGSAAISQPSQPFPPSNCNNFHITKI